MENPPQLPGIYRVLSLISTSDDLVVPVDKIAECIEHLNEVSKKYSFKLLCLAHAGDGNLHFQILKCDLSEEEWEKQLSEFHAEAMLMFTALADA